MGFRSIVMGPKSLIEYAELSLSLGFYTTRLEYAFRYSSGNLRLPFETSASYFLFKSNNLFLAVPHRSAAMKFGKRFTKQIEETLPEWRDKFVSYKLLKRLLNSISSASAASPSRDLAGSAAAEARFVRLLDSEVEKLNAFFVEQEEDFIIRQQDLKERMKEVVEESGPTGLRPSETEMEAAMGRIRKDIVNLHGEMVLLVNYSIINYTGLAKILKKYDKRTGGLLRLPFIDKVLKQPFFTTDLISKLVKDCETAMDGVFSGSCGRGGGGEGCSQAAAAAAAERDDVFRSTVAALVTMRELRKGSSTYSHFSLPPMSSPDLDFLQYLQIPSPIPTQ